MKLTFLGTGAGKPSVRRNVTAIALDLVQERGSVWLFDCGEATQHQLMRSPVSAHKIEAVFMTHLHGDHLWGLPGLLASRSISSNPQPLSVYGPVGLKEFIDTVLRLSSSFLSYPLNVVELESQTGIVFQDEQFTVYVQALEHRIPSLGYRIEQADQLGKLDVGKLEQNGILSGAHLQSIKRGETVQLADGRVIHGADYVSAVKLGRVVTILGDTVPTMNALSLAAHADILVHEATMEAALTQKANTLGHSSTIQAAQLALEAQVKRLIITHISARYQEDDDERLLAECRAIFPQTEMAHDLQTFMI